MRTFGRAVLGGFFVLAGINKLANYTDTLDDMAAGNLPGLLLPLVIALEIGGGLIIATGRPVRGLKWTAIALVLFTLATNIAFHRFWQLDGELAQLELSLFFKNLAIAGALLMVTGSTRDAPARGLEMKPT